MWIHNAGNYYKSGSFCRDIVCVLFSTQKNLALWRILLRDVLLTIDYDATEQTGVVHQMENTIAQNSMYIL